MPQLGVISDTHGLIRPEALSFLAGSEAILHAGDIGHPRVLEALEQIAPVIVIRGNVDRGEWAQSIAETCSYVWAGKQIFLIHNISELSFDPSAQYHIVVYGHSHKPSMHWDNGVLFFNPGSAGPRRFHLPISLGSIQIEAGELVAQHHTLSV